MSTGYQVRNLDALEAAPIYPIYEVAASMEKKKSEGYS